MKERQKIDDLFREALSDYREELPSINTEGKIFRKLNYNKYLRLFKTNLNIFVIALPIALLSYTLVNKEQKNSLPETNKTTEIKETIINQKPRINKVFISKANNNLHETEQIEYKEIFNQTQSVNKDIEKQISNTSTFSEKQDKEVVENNKVNNKQLPVEQTNNVENQKETLSTKKETDLSTNKTTEIKEVIIKQKPQVNEVFVCKANNNLHGTEQIEHKEVLKQTQQNIHCKSY